MDTGAVKTLFLPLASGDVPSGSRQARWLFLNAAVPPIENPLAKTQIAAVQTMRPQFNALKDADFAVTPEAPDGLFEGALVLISRHRGQTRALINQALDRVVPGGMIVCAGGKHDGIEAMAREAARLFPLSGSLSKHHARVFWFANSGAARFENPPPVLADGRFETASGMFSSGHADPGSAFLMEHLPRDLKGHIADFCAGWGYLSVEAAHTCPKVKTIALYEADHAALDAAKANMARLAPDLAASFHWLDLAGEPVAEAFDTIIMNPPFHAGRRAEPELGGAIIRSAANALHRGGSLYMVANRTLPYEDVLAAAFHKSGELARNGSYKVLWALK